MFAEFWVGEDWVANAKNACDITLSEKKLEPRFSVKDMHVCGQESHSS